MGWEPDHGYQRVIPRDLFNESKLLKCLGQLALLIHDGKDQGRLTIEHDGRAFRIVQDQSSGELICTNLQVRIRGGRTLRLASSYNSKEPYPLCYGLCDRLEVEEEGEVFEDDGTFTSEFLAAIGADVPPLVEPLTATKFAAGYEDSQGSCGMFAGPSPHLTDILAARPDDPELPAYIFELWPNGMSRKVYCWRDVTNGWELLTDKDEP